MPIDDYTGDKPDSPANAATTPGKYIKIAVADFSDTAANVNPGTMAPTPLSSYLRLGAVEDVAKAGKASTSGPVGLITDLAGNPLQADPNAPYNPVYDPYAPFGPHNLPKDGQGPLPPLSTPTSGMPALPDGAPAYLAAPGPDPTGEDLASLVQGFADDTRNRGLVYMTAEGSMTSVFKPVSGYTPGGQPADPGATLQGPMYGYPWVTPVPGPKAPGTLDSANVSKTEDAAFTAASKPPFFPDDYRTLESSQLHTKGGWRDHTDGNRITTTRGDKIEVIRGNYKLIVLGRQDQTKPKYAGMDISGGQATTTGSDLTADASTDFNQGSTAYSSLFEWRQCTTHKLFEEAVKAALHDSNFNAWKAVADADLAAAQQAQAELDQTTLKAQGLADPLGYLGALITAAQRAVLVADTPAHTTKATNALTAAKKTLLTLEQAIDPNLLEGTAMVALAATALPGTSTADAFQCWNAAAAQTTATSTATWDAPGTPPANSVAQAATLAKLLDVQAQGSMTWNDAWTAYSAWAGIALDTKTAAQDTADAGNAANAATAAAAAEAAAAQAAAAQTAADTAAAPSGAAVDQPADAAHFGADAAQAAAAAQAASAAQQAADAAAQAKTDATDPTAVPTAPLATAAKNALAMWTQPVGAVQAAATASKSAKAAAKADATLAADPTNASKQAAAQAADQQAAADATAAAQAALPPKVTTSTQAANAANAAQLVWNLAQLTPPGLNLTDAAAQAWAKAAYSAGMAQAAAMAAGLFSSPLDTLQLWEDGDKSPSEYRSFATTKKGSGPKVQVKYQKGGKHGLYDQDRGKHSPDVPGDGVTYATPVSMGVLINETWSYQIHNYSGIGYYPATAPQPWPPAPPKGQFRPIGGTPLDGGALPAEPPKREKDALAHWSKVPEWVIYPVSKIVNKSYVVDQSSEVFADRTVSITAGLRPFPKDAPNTKHPVSGFDPREPYRTYPTDVPKWVDATGTARSSYKDTLHDTHNLPSKATYDRDLLTDKDMAFPSKLTLEAWILNPDPTKEVATIRDYHKVEQTWTETHVKHQAAFVRAGTVLSDTKVDKDQYTNVVVGGGSNSNTTVGGTLHTMLHTGSTTVDTNVDASQTTTVHAGDIFSHTVAGSITTTSAVSGPIVSASAAMLTNTFKAAVLDLQVALLGASASLQVGATAKMQLGPMASVQIGPHVSQTIPQDVAMTGLKTLLAGGTVHIDGNHTHLSLVHTFT